MRPRVERSWSHAGPHSGRQWPGLGSLRRGGRKKAGSIEDFARCLSGTFYKAISRSPRAGRYWKSHSKSVCFVCEGSIFLEKESVSRRQNTIFEKIQSLPQLHTTKKHVFHPHGAPSFLADRNFLWLVTQHNCHKC